MTSSITPYEFFFDAQQKRFLEQLVRAFSGFCYQTGRVLGGAPETIPVPCTMAYTNRQAASIVQNNSENTLNAVPHIVVYQTGLRGRREDLQNRTFVDHRQVFEREIQNGNYGPGKGNAYTVDRLMPLPFNMEVSVDVWVSNLEQKHQLLEQILIAMYPDFQVQNSDNPLDWSADTICYIEDEIEFTSRTVPIGSNDDIDFFSLRLRLPIWLTPPAKVKRISQIEEVVANVGDLVTDPVYGKQIGNVHERTIVTPGNHFIRIDGGVVTLLGDKGADTMPDGSLPSWTELFTMYGTFQSGASEMRLLLTAEPDGPFVSGTLSTGSNPNEVILSIDADTLPANTIQPVDAVIDPMTSFPGQKLPAPVEGTRYLLIEDMGNSLGWGYCKASAYDIIEYNSGAWSVSFDSRSNVAQQYVLNLNTGRQLRWTGKEWVMSVDTYFSPGYWRLSL